MANLSREEFQALLAKARAISQARKAEDEAAAISTIEEGIKQHRPTDVDLTNLNITKQSITTPEGQESAIETLQDLAASISQKQRAQPQTDSSEEIKEEQKKVEKDAGVARKVTLNSLQQLALETALKGDDFCLIGAAGTGKTTTTGVIMKSLLASGHIKELEVSTKRLLAGNPGIAIVSFTRKAVANIRRALPDELKPCALSIHALLEFEPEFYDVEDPNNPGQWKKTMRFEPKRTAYNPLPSSLSLVVHEESSMESTELYNLLSAALPHNPQEIFIGDIRQLPPIFGPAILGFKMSLLPVVELKEVYRQAMLSPIIRLAHAILSGDGKKFDPKAQSRKEKNQLGQLVDRKYVPALEAFNESNEHGSVKIQIWQKKLEEMTACDTAVKQFIAWSKSGYYSPAEDLILCPFNKSFGTIELNKGILQHLGKERGAIVHEIIAGFNKHYYAIGDRVMFDKEDAIIVDIRRNVSYLGKSPLPASVNLNRNGYYEEDLSEKELEKAADEDAEITATALDRFMEIEEEGEERVQAASHAIDIRYTYSEDLETLSSAAHINALLGWHAITVHKAQGSENRAIFVVLHASHAVMVQNELLYTAVTRAREKLHIICETDTLYKGVKSQKVRGVTLEEKIKFFQGKVEFKEMEKELELLTRQREQKKRLRELEAAEKLRQKQEENEEDDSDWDPVGDERDSYYESDTDDKPFPDEAQEEAATNEGFREGSEELLSPATAEQAEQETSTVAPVAPVETKEPELTPLQKLQLKLKILQEGKK